MNGVDWNAKLTKGHRFILDDMSGEVVYQEEEPADNPLLADYYIERIDVLLNTPGCIIGEVDRKVALEIKEELTKVWITDVMSAL